MSWRVGKHTLFMVVSGGFAGDFCEKNRCLRVIENGEFSDPTTVCMRFFAMEND